MGRRPPSSAPPSTSPSSTRSTSGTRGARSSLLERYVEKRARSGHFAAVGDATVAARFIVETVAWFAWHGRGDPDPELLPDDETVRAEVLRRIVSSFVPA